MTNEDLILGNKIKKEIKELENFIHVAGSVWTGKIIKQTSKYIFKSSPYGVFNSAEYFMDTEIKNKVLDVLKDRLRDLKVKLDSI